MIGSFRAGFEHLEVRSVHVCLRDREDDGRLLLGVALRVEASVSDGSIVNGG